MLKRLRKEGSLWKLCTVASLQKWEEMEAKSLSKTESQLMILLSCEMSRLGMVSFQQEGNFGSKGEGRRNFKDAYNPISETLEPCVILSTSKCNSISVLSACARLTEWK